MIMSESFLLLFLPIHISKNIKIYLQFNQHRINGSPFNDKLGVRFLFFREGEMRKENYRKTIVVGLVWRWSERMAKQ